MARKRKKNVWAAGELNLTAMIDIALQILNFFIMTAKPPEVMSQLSVMRPQAEKVVSKVTPPPMLTIMVWPKVFTINNKPMDIRQMDAVLAKLSATDKNQTLLIECINAAPHRQLITLLDLCSKHKMTNLSVVSSGGY